ncbi:VOC family protein [Prauserella muralis]|uniref:Glyoxalase n=1 Tax=Prauserella muralis TaxID=588067 RepID=A0A2V4AZP1_9PSEU|nr:VOC family protein [Prauserella muralis]PXY27470.1 glyoxalase [Prauserella muralis]TWE22818.1 catechol 2,3-dioxygenase-like lactoylglutathione lyase family enzyme [Prauserella muralis]
MTQQTDKTNKTDTAIGMIRTVGVPVSDQDRALAFYTGALGFEPVVDVPMAQLGGRWIEVRPPGSPVSVALSPAPGRGAAGVDTGIRFTTADATALHARLSEQDVDVDELLRWEGVPPMFGFRDPDGNVLYVVEDR